MKNFLILFVILIFFMGCKKQNETLMEPTPIAAFDYTTPNYDQIYIQFINNSQFADSFKWEFGDNELSNEKNPKHTYALIGTYIVKLSVTGPLGSDTFTKEITIVPRPKVTINKITINAIEPFDDKGTPWDTMDAPDVYVHIRRNRTDIFDNMTNRFDNNIVFPISWTLQTPIIIEGLDFFEHCSIYIMDYDKPQANQVMCNFGLFSPYKLAEKKPPVVNFKASGKKFDISLDLTWQ